MWGRKLKWRFEIPNAADMQWVWLSGPGARTKWNAHNTNSYKNLFSWRRLAHWSFLLAVPRACINIWHLLWILLFFTRSPHVILALWPRPTMGTNEAGCPHAQDRARCFASGGKEERAERGRKKILSSFPSPQNWWRGKTFRLGLPPSPFIMLETDQITWSDIPRWQHLT